MWILLLQTGFALFALYGPLSPCPAPPRPAPPRHAVTLGTQCSRLRSPQLWALRLDYLAPPSVARTPAPPRPPRSYMWNPLSWAMEAAAIIAIALLDYADFALIVGTGLGLVANSTCIMSG